MQNRESSSPGFLLMPTVLEDGFDTASRLITTAPERVQEIGLRAGHRGRVGKTPVHARRLAEEHRAGPRTDVRRPPLDRPAHRS